MRMRRGPFPAIRQGSFRGQLPWNVPTAAPGADDESRTLKFGQSYGKKPFRKTRHGTEPLVGTVGRKRAIAVSTKRAHSHPRTRGWPELGAKGSRSASELIGSGLLLSSSRHHFHPSTGLSRLKMSA